MTFEDAVRAVPDGTVIDFDVSPNARQTQVPSGYNEWRKRLEAKLKAPPEKGRANEELINALSALLGVPEMAIEITSGARDSKKSVRVAGLRRDDIIRTLGGKLR